ncbi:MAG: DUF3987 domain-containing protein [Candidatus Acidiferrales bacterium]
MEEIARACKIIVSGAKRGRVVEVRALNTPQGTWSGYFTDSTIIQAVYDLSAQETTPNVYWTIQEITREVLQPGTENILASNVINTTNDKQVERFLHLPIDCDPVRPAGTSSTDAEKAAAYNVAQEIRDILLVRGIESILADSGNGYHVLVRINLLVDDTSKDFVKNLLIVLAKIFGTPEVDIDTSVYNPSRILKIYGTVARKGEHTAERPWRTSALVDVPEGIPVVPEETLRGLLADLIKDLPAEKVSEIKKGNTPADPRSKDLISEYRNKTLTSIAGTYREKGLNEEEIRMVLDRINQERCDPALPEHEIDSIARSVAKYKEGDPVRDSPASIIFAPPNPLAGVQQVIEEQPKEWGIPEEINDGLSPVLPFDISFVPNCMQAFIVDTAALMSVPLDFTGITLLAVLAGCVNRRAFVFPKKHYKKWREALAASGALVTPSGGLKTPTFKIFTNILVEKQVDWQGIHKEKMKKYEQAAKLVKEENKKRKDSESLLLDMPEKPAPSRRLISNDSTPEKLHMMLAENPVGLFVGRDELSGWIAELDKPGREGQRSLFLAAMNGDDAHSVERISRDDVFAIMSLSIYGGIQPPLLVNFINDERNIWDGTLARLGLLVYPDEVFIPTADREANEAAYLVARKVLRTLAEMETKQVMLHFDDAAQPFFDQWFEELRVKIDNEKHPGKKSHISKYRGLLPKLAGLLQLADLVGSLPSGVLARDDGDTAAAITGAHYISVGYLQRAIKLLSYLESHMHRVYGLNRTPNTRAVFALAKKVREGEVRSGFSIRDITRNDWNDLTEADHVKFAVEALEDKGWLREKIADTSKRGRPTQRWEINPAALDWQPGTKNGVRSPRAEGTEV